MTDAVVLTTYDWVPELPRGFVRDIRIRWVLEETGRPYRIETVPVHPKSDAHLAHQPFGQVPFVQDGPLNLFESGAILLHLSKGTDLLPEGDQGTLALQWVIAALNSVEPAVTNWLVARFFRKDDTATEAATGPMMLRLGQLQAALAGRDWLLGNGFSVADLLMADVLRVPDRGGMLQSLPGLATYLDRARARPAFQKAHADQMAHWAAADSARKAG